MTDTSPRLSAQTLSAYIRNVEFPHRTSAYPSEFAERVLRYGAFVGSEIEHHEKLDRAMLHARSLIGDHEAKNTSVKSGTIIIADRLSGGKGRFTRSWHAPVGGLWGTMIYVSTLLPSSRLLLPLAVGIACCEAVRENGAPEAVIRWINDVLVDGKKIAGFLLEGFYGSVSREEYNLIGFGINVNNRGFPEDLEGQAISLNEQVGSAVDLEAFSYCFIAKICWNIGILCSEEQRFLREESWSGSEGRHLLLEQWRRLSDSPGRRVLFGFDVIERPQYEATVVGISEDGGLQLALDDGSLLTEHSGEIRYLPP